MDSKASEIQEHHICASHNQRAIDTATFISTIKFTEQGIKGIDQTTKRATAVNAAAKKVGVKVTNIYWTLDQSDGVLIFEAPDDETATALLLNVGTTGNVQTTTVRAFTAAEMDKILAKVHG
jgi:uncharacterized protein with GYD domain